jgi:hypothetical protein
LYQLFDKPNLQDIDTVSPVRLDNGGNTVDCFRDTSPAFPSCFSSNVWKPSAIKIQAIDKLEGGEKGDDDDDTDGSHSFSVFPSIGEVAAELLFSLLCKILVYEVDKRVRAKDLLNGHGSIRVV